MLLRALVDLAAPHECAGCATLGTAWCAPCRAAVHQLGRSRPALVDLEASGTGGIGGTEGIEGDLPVHALAPYADPLRSLLVAYKDRGRVDLTPVLASLLRGLLAEVLLTDQDCQQALAQQRLLVVPVPTSAAAHRRRGRRPWEEVVAAAVGGEPGLPMRAVLHHRRRVRDQVGLTRTQRRANVRGAFAVVGSLAPGVTVLLMDDVCTTGATVTAAAWTLRRAGAAHVVAVVLARVTL